MPAATAAEPITATIPTIAILTGLDRLTVRRAVTLGHVPEEGRNHYNVEAARAAIREHTDPLRVLGHAKGGRGGMREDQLAGLGEGEGASRHIASGINAKRELDAIKLASARLDYDTKRGALIDAAAANEAARMLVGKLRARVLAIPKFAAPRLDGLDYAARRAVLEEECRAALEDVANVEDIVREIIG